MKNTKKLKLISLYIIMANSPLYHNNLEDEEEGEIIEEKKL